MNYTNKILTLVLLISSCGIHQAFAQVDPGGSLTGGDVTTCSNLNINVDDLTVTNDAGTAIDASACTYTQGDLEGYLNCIAENNDIPTGSNFVVELSKEADYLNGVSTVDLVLIYRDLLKVEEFDDSCDVVASDLDGDNKVNVKDLVLMRRLILGIITELPGPSWRFYNSHEINISGIGPETALTFAKDEFPLSNLKVTGIKVGDVNASVFP